MPYLLDGHHDLNGVEAVEPEVVGEVRRRLDLLNSSAKPSQTPTLPNLPPISSATYVRRIVDLFPVSISSIHILKIRLRRPYIKGIRQQRKGHQGRKKLTLSKPCRSDMMRPSTSSLFSEPPAE